MLFFKLFQLPFSYYNINYLSFFHISQTKHLKTLLTRLKEFDNEIEDNVNGNHAYSVDDVEEADALRKFDYNEYDEPPTITMIEPVDESSSVSIQQFNTTENNTTENNTTENDTIENDATENDTIENDATENDATENNTVNITLVPENTDETKYIVEQFS